jgi:ketosteroid isomerase-like protein
MTVDKAEFVRSIFGAWNSGDVDAFVAHLTDDVEWHPLVVSAIEGDGHVFRRHDGFREFAAGWANTWETWNLGIEGFLEFGGEQILALTHVRAKGRGSGIEFDQKMGHLLEFKGDLICRGQSFLERDVAVSFAEDRAKTA